MAAPDESTPPFRRRRFLQLAGTGALAAWTGLPARSLAGRAPAEALDLSRWLQPVPPQAMFALPGYHVWCGTMIRDDRGTCHLFYSRWRIEEGFSAWVTHSEVAHATASHPLGPYRHVGVALPERGPAFWDGHCTHNPTVIRDGETYYLYYTGNRGDRVRPVRGLNWTHRNNQRIGVAVAKSPDGPWQRFDQPLIEPTPGFHDAKMGSNPAITRRADGSWLLIYKAVADKRPQPAGGPVVHVVATANAPTGPFHKHPEAVFVRAGADFPAEDPFVWREGGRYWAVVKDMKGFFTGQGRSLALMASADGIEWAPATHVLVSRTEFQRADGTLQKCQALERPQLWLERGEPSVLFCAVSLGAATDATGTFNVAIPLRRPAPGA